MEILLACYLACAVVTVVALVTISRKERWELNTSESTGKAALGILVWALLWPAFWPLALIASVIGEKQE